MTSDEDFDLAEAFQAWPWVLTASTIWELVERRAATTPDRRLLIAEDGTVLTCREFRDKAERVAAALAALGVGPGSRVAWQLPTRISTVLVMVALRRLGALQAPIIPIYREREVTTAVQLAQADLLLVPGTWNGFDHSAMAAELNASGAIATRVEVIGQDAPESDDLTTLPPNPVQPEAALWMYFTSGSTGMPKGVRHCDRSLLSGAFGFAAHGRLGEREDEVAALGFPFAHSGGISFTATLLSGGFPALLIEAFDAAGAVELFTRHRVTVTGGATPFYQMLLAHQRAHPGTPLYPDLRKLVGGGAPCSASLFEAARDELGVVVAHDYGMTEVPLIAVGDPQDPEDLLADTDGHILPGNRVRVRGLDGQLLTDGSTGELEVSGRALCLGYTDEAATSVNFTGDGWLRTGDTGRVRDGDIVEVVGRTKDMIIRKGENVAPAEIEGLLAGHPSVAEVAVIGLPDEERGERICAVVALREGAPVIDLRSLTEWLSEAGLIRQKLPEQLELVDTLPRTGLAKVAKLTLRERFTQRQPA
ncbi:AMP-binding protein [Rhodococcus pseudokoreensis]|uniref:AMP-binding protein n=1 Tax=Rhodococcus pseudokoreensis TaxID=2811421 RepID=A0A974ZYR3_9NOCA|nr:AMP-binding protein [Rhodococcus pseudokoreensis]QSE94961.1 AMP-binding protein [Rhodococcus pseudokoreensis]